jgi:hypothetical protein
MRIEEKAQQLGVRVALDKLGPGYGRDGVQD